MKFKLAFVKDNQPLIKMVLDNDEEVWAETNDKVCSFAKSNFKENEVCDIDFEEKEDGSYFVNRITKKGGTVTPPKVTVSTPVTLAKRGRPAKVVSTEPTSSQKKCACGATIKDARYNQCYTCNQAKKAQPEEEVVDDGKKYCECGAEIKNIKYDKCFKCNQASKISEPEPQENGLKHCACGAVIKNPKYDKCFKCNKIDKESSPDTGKPSKGAPYGSVTQEEGERRNKLAVLNAICQAVGTVMAGQVNDVDTLADMILETHKKIYSELFKK